MKHTGHCKSPHIQPTHGAFYTFYTFLRDKKTAPRAQKYKQAKTKYTF